MSLCAECGWTDPEPPAACARPGCPLLPVIIQRRERLIARTGVRASEPIPSPLREYSGGGRDLAEGVSDNYSSRDFDGFGLRG